MAELSSTLLYAAFFLYLVATVLFGGAIKQKKDKWKRNKVNGHF